MVTTLPRREARLFVKFDGHGYEQYVPEEVLAQADSMTEPNEIDYVFRSASDAKHAFDRIAWRGLVGAFIVDNADDEVFWLAR